MQQEFISRHFGNAVCGIVKQIFLAGLSVDSFIAAAMRGHARNKIKAYNCIYFLSACVHGRLCLQQFQIENKQI